MLYHIVAMAKNRVIGKDNKLPWHFSEDLKHFKNLTTGSTVIMGRKTFESIHHATKGKLLPEREMIVLTRKGKVNLPLDAFQRVFFLHSLDEALDRKNRITENAFIIGGEDLYRQTIDKVDGIYLTRIDADYDGDAFYPEIPDSFDEVDIEALREKDPKIEVVFYQKKQKETEEGSAG